MHSLKKAVMRRYSVSRAEVVSPAALGCQQVFGFNSTLRCTSQTVSEAGRCSARRLTELLQVA